MHPQLVKLIEDEEESKGNNITNLKFIKKWGIWKYDAYYDAYTMLGFCKSRDAD